MAKDRETRIPEQFDPVPAGWELNGEPVRVDAEDEDQLAKAVWDAVTIMRYIGGAVTMLPIRVELAPGTDIYKTVEYAFKWNSFVPPARPEPKPEPVAEAEPEREPALAA